MRLKEKYKNNSAKINFYRPSNLITFSSLKSNNKTKEYYSSESIFDKKKLSIENDSLLNKILEFHFLIALLNTPQSGLLPVLSVVLTLAVFHEVCKIIAMKCANGTS